MPRAIGLTRITAATGAFRTNARPTNGWSRRRYAPQLWRTVKYEHVYPHEYAMVPELEKGLHEYFEFYNQERLHQSLSYQTPAEVHFAQMLAACY
jgi:transposase InsO family protein